MAGHDARPLGQRGRPRRGGGRSGRRHRRTRAPAPRRGPVRGRVARSATSGTAVDGTGRCHLPGAHARQGTVGPCSSTRSTSTPPRSPSAPAGWPSPRDCARATCACRRPGSTGATAPSTSNPAGRATADAARARRRARPLGARSRIGGPGPHHGDCRRSRADRRSTAIRSGCRPSTGARCCSWRGPAGEAAAPACPGGRPSTLNWRRAGLTVVTVALDVDPEKARPWIEAAAPTHPSVDRHRARDRRAVRLRQRADGGVDRRVGRARAAGRAGGYRAQPAARHGDPARHCLTGYASMLEQVKAINDPSAEYRAAIVDWVEHGAASRFALGARRGHRPLGRPLGRPRPGRGVLRARPAPVAHGRATTPPCRGGARRTGCSPRTGRTSARRGRSSPRPRGADSDLIQGPNDVYEGNWLDDVLAAGGGAEYYAAVNLD